MHFARDDLISKWNLWKLAYFWPLTFRRVLSNGRIWVGCPRRRLVPSRICVPRFYESFTLDKGSFASLLETAPLEFTAEADTNPLQLSLPKPDGTFEAFAIVESPIMAPELAAAYPDINTYSGYSLDTPGATIRFDLTPAGFHAQVLSPEGSYMIDPYYHLDQSVYVSYDRATASVDAETLAQRADATEQLHSEEGDLLFHSDLGTVAEPAERVMDHDHDDHLGHGHHSIDTLDQALLDEPDASDNDPPVLERTGQTLRTYRLANATTVEYTNFHGGTKALSQAAVVTAVNRVTQVYEVELTIRLELVANNDDVVFVGTDNYSNNNGGAMLSQNQSVMDSTIGNANYDIGHVFSTGGGGVAFLGVVGVTGSKAGGVTGLFSPINDAFYIDYVAHEMGHQFDATHTFNGDSGSCSGGNRTGNSAYEPGSGSTIMAYAGICGNDDLQSNSDPYFHSTSLDDIITYVDNFIPGVGTRMSTGNSQPVANAGPNYAIPTGTPYRLTGTGSDPDNDLLTYNWEQRDLGPQRDIFAVDNGSSPLHRSWDATTSPVRYLPRLQNLVNNTTNKGEKLPAVARSNHRWRLTVRDNAINGGGVDTDDMIINVVDTGAAFQMTSQNSNGILWFGGASETVTWNVAGTDAGVINTPNVNILLSTDGGFTYPTTLAANVPNDGSHDVVVPLVNTSQARIMIEGAGNIFFDINNRNFEILGTDTSGPVATAVAADVTMFNAPNQTITVTYVDPSGVDVSDIDDNDLEIVGPNGTYAATLISTSSSSDTTPVTAVYELAPPGGNWDFSDNGLYTINAIAGELTDTAGNPIAAGAIGSFTATVPEPGTSCSNPFPAGLVGDGGADFFYNPVTGIMSIRIDSSTVGDEVNAVLIEGPDALDYMPAGAPFWGATAYFGGKVQLLIYNGNINLGLPFDLPLLQYATDLTAADFGCVDFGTIGDGGGNPGSTAYANVAIVTDTQAPTANATVSDVTTAGGTTHTFDVTFTDNSEVEFADIVNGVIEVTGPNGYSEIANIVSVTPTTDAASLTATLSIPAAGGTWDAADTGTYTISVAGFQVTDLSNNFVAGGTIGSFDVNLTGSTPGDFDNDGDFDCDDVDALSAAIIAGSSDSTFDLDASGTVNVADLHFWVTDIKGTILGDANLDFTVDGQDFLIWNANKFTSGNAWCSADFDGNGIVDGADFLIWNANKFQSAGPIVTPPAHEEERSLPVFGPEVGGSEVVTDVQTRELVWQETPAAATYARTATVRSAAKLTSIRDAQWHQAVDDVFGNFS